MSINKLDQYSQCAWMKKKWGEYLKWRFFWVSFVNSVFPHSIHMSTCAWYTIQYEIYQIYLFFIVFFAISKINKCYTILIVPKLFLY